MNINIAYGATQNWLEYACISILSILKHANIKHTYNFYIMCDKHTKVTLAKFTSLKKYFHNTVNIEFHFITMNNTEFDGVIHDWLGVSASYRLKLSTLINEDKILYLDCDTLIRRDISNLFLYNIDKYYIAMAEDKCSKMMASRIELRNNETFYNSGVALINLKAFRENNIENKLFEILKHKDFFTDQDALNYVCKGNILSLPLTWNHIYPLYNNDQVTHYPTRLNELMIAKSNPAILHFSSKPWNSDSQSVFPEWYELKNEFEKISNIN